LLIPVFSNVSFHLQLPAAGGFRDLFSGFPEQRSLTIGDTCKIQHFFHHFFLSSTLPQQPAAGGFRDLFSSFGAPPVTRDILARRGP
jgi:hypothetical protein